MYTDTTIFLLHKHVIQDLQYNWQLLTFQVFIRYQDVPVIVAGDFNGPEDSPVCECIFEEEFESAYKTVHGHEPKVTHKDHSENCVAVDYIFYR